MVIRQIYMLLACIGLVLVASTAVAGSIHSHGHASPLVIADGMPLNPNAVKAASPFEVKPGSKVLHCKLLGHSPLIPCPHHKVPADGKDECYLTTDCGGGPFQAPSSRSVGDPPRYLISEAMAENDLPIAVRSIHATVCYDPFYSHLIDRPPRAL
jgi:hypothetical protein